jgi:branched-chain amino acid transport system permease protein
VIQVLLNGLVSGLLLALPALALALTFSVLRFANFAVGSMMTVGAYAIYLFNSLAGLHLAQAAVLGSLCCGLLAAVYGRAIFRPLRERGAVILLLASMGLSFVLENAARLAAGNEPKGYLAGLARPIRLGSALRVNREQIVIAAVSLSALALVWIVFHHTRLGRAMRAMADTPPLAAVRGVPGERVTSAVWILSGALAALAGMLVGLDTTIDPLMGHNHVVAVFAAAILGGLANPVGAIAGAMVMGVLSEASTLVVPPHYRTVVAFAALAVLLLVRPSGLMSRTWLEK